MFNNGREQSPDLYPTFSDVVYGDIQYGATTTSDEEQKFDDIVLLKSNGWPTYHLANVVDDHLMDVTHVIRGTVSIDNTHELNHKLIRKTGMDAINTKTRVPLSSL